MRKIKKSLRDVPNHSLENVAIVHAEVFAVKSSLATTIAPAHGHVLSLAAPSAVIDDGLRRIDDLISSLEQAKSKIVVIGCRKLSSCPQTLIETANGFEDRAIRHHMAAC